MRSVDAIAQMPGPIREMRCPGWGSKGLPDVLPGRAAEAGRQGEINLGRL